MLSSQSIEFMTMCFEKFGKVNTIRDHIDMDRVDVGARTLQISIGDELDDIRKRQEVSLIPLFLND